MTKLKNWIWIGLVLVLSIGVSKSNPASGGQFMPTCGVLPMVFPVVLCYTERKDANAAETGRFSACTVSILQNGVSGWI